jgi:hypothetical protein
MHIPKKDGSHKTGDEKDTRSRRVVDTWNRMMNFITPTEIPFMDNRRWKAVRRLECSWIVRHAVICVNHVTGAWLASHERGGHHRTRREKTRAQEGEWEKALYYLR